jgi:hypothetical protein
VRRAGIDPATGHRYLEEVSFEIFFRQSSDYARDRARDVVGYGVRRMFGIFVKERWPGSDDAGVVDCTVAEWSAERDEWIVLGPDEVITDPCLYPPIPVQALVDALASSDAAARALIARHNRVVQEHTAQERSQAFLEGQRVALRRHLFRTLEHRQIALDEIQRARIHACDDLATLERWALRASEVKDPATLLD